MSTSATPTTSMTMPTHAGPNTLQISPQQLFSSFSISTAPPPSILHTAVKKV
jgi:hypothetical protein